MVHRTLKLEIGNEVSLFFPISNFQFQSATERKINISTLSANAYFHFEKALVCSLK